MTNMNHCDESERRVVERVLRPRKHSRLWLWVTHFGGAVLLGIVLIAMWRW